MKTTNYFATLFLIILTGFVQAQSFYDGPSGESIGNFPSKWNLIKGSAEIASLNGSPIIYLANESIIAPKIPGNDYLSQNFTLEFDAFYDEASTNPVYQSYQVRFWKEIAYHHFGANNRDYFTAMNLFCHGGRFHGIVNNEDKNYKAFKKELEIAKNVWRHYTIQYNNGALKVFIDNLLIINVPHVSFNPRIISIGATSKTYVDFVRAIRNINITGIQADSSAEGNPTSGENTDLAGNGSSNTTTNPTAQTNYKYTFPVEDGNAGQVLKTDGNGNVNWVDDTHPETNTTNTNTTTNYEYTLPQADGAPNQVLQTDGNGTVTWVDNPSTSGNTGSNTTATAQKINDLLDGKSDQGGSSVFLGLDAGLNDDGSDNNNVGLGYQALYSNTSGGNNTANGASALSSNTTGNENTAIGSQALYNNTIGEKNTATGTQTLYNNTEGGNNTANGYQALYSNTTGEFNTAIGFQALFSNKEGSSNTAVGFKALFSSIQKGNDNTAIGFKALYSNTKGIQNTAIGSYALNDNTEGSSNTAIGASALTNNTTGSGNTSIGKTALSYNTEGSSNTANGYAALYKNTTGNSNIAFGVEALYSNTTGNNNTAIGTLTLRWNYDGVNNTAIGVNALHSNNGNQNTANGAEALYSNTVGERNTATGYQALYKNKTSNGSAAFGFAALYNNTTGRRNTAVGANALNQNTSGSNNTAIGYDAQVPDGTASNQIRIGNTAIRYAGVQVPWNITSDKRWKDNIRNLPYGLNFVNQLIPVDYIRKNNDKKTREMGFIAQDVEALLNKMGYTDQGFLTKDDKGFMSLRYNDFIALLTKAIQEQQQIIENQNKTIQSLTAEMADTKNEQESKLRDLYKRVELLEQATNQ